jgi:hypothetical protein
MQSFRVATVTQNRSRANELRKDRYRLILRSAWRSAYPFIALQDLTLVSLLPPSALAA